MDPKLKRWMKELGEAINSSVSEAEPIADVIGKIKDQGYDVFLVLEATIGFNKRELEIDEKPAPKDRGSSTEPEFRISSQDVRFLRSLRISLEGDQPNDRPAT